MAKLVGHVISTHFIEQSENLQGMVNGKEAMPKHPMSWREVAMFGCVILLAGCAATEQMSAGTPLYDRLGGKSSLSAIIEQFVINVLADTRINGRFATTDIRKLKTSLVDQVCAVAGGPCTYRGRDMKSAHAGMKISREDFKVVVEDLLKALDTLKVPVQEKRELLQLLEPMKKEIVE